MVCYYERWASVANIKDSAGARGHEANCQSSLHRTGRPWPNRSHLPRNDGLWPITRPVLPSRRTNQTVKNTRNKTKKISITVSGSGEGRGSGGK